MKITDEIEAALHSVINIFGSKSAFARRANISVYTLHKYLKRHSKTISDDSWEKLYPYLSFYLPKKHSQGKGKLPPYKDFLSTEQRILLDAFNELSAEGRESFLKLIVEQATQEIRSRN